MRGSQASDSKTDSGYLPRLRPIEWVTFAALAALLALMNIYTTLLTGWGDTGSIIAVLASVAILSIVGRGRRPTVHTLNLGQTMVSAGGSIGFAAAMFAAVPMIAPDFEASPLLLAVMFAGMGLLGAVIGSSVRRSMVRYFFPSGTACAVIQRTVAMTGPESARPVRLLAIWGALSAAITVPTKIALSKGGHALLGMLPLGTLRGQAIGVSLEPLLWGIGLVVGPRIGVGILLGGLAPFFVFDLLGQAGVAQELHVSWQRWIAVAVLTLPTFAAIVFAYLFRVPPVIPPGFEPGKTSYRVPPGRNVAYAAIGLAALLVTGLTAQALFDLPWHAVVITVAVAWPLCVVNGRVTGDTDINPVRLVAIVILSLLAVLAGGDVVALLGMAVIGGTLAGVAVDMMQDYRTGYLVDANPSHQTTVQLFGALIGALVAIPFVLMLIDRIGIGPETSLPAPGAQVWSAVAQAFTGGFEFTSGLITMIVLVSVIGAGYAYFTVWPRTQAWMPSIFGMGIGLLLPFHMCAAIFAGSAIHWIIKRVYVTRAEPTEEVRVEALARAGNDTMLVGSSVFAASAVVSVLVLLVTGIMARLGLGWFFLAGH